MCHKAELQSSEIYVINVKDFLFMGAHDAKS